MKVSALCVSISYKTVNLGDGRYEAKLKAGHLRRVSYLLLILGILTFLYVAFFDFNARFVQDDMLERWGNKTEDNRTEDNRQKLLKVERKGKNRDELGILMIPKLGLKQVVLFDSTKQNLAKGPSMIKGTSYPGTLGNSAIAGHRVSYGFPFRNIHKLRTGDEIIFQNNSGKVIYEVEKKVQVKPSDTSVLKPTPYPRVTLVSCDPPFSAKFRLIVIATAKNYKSR